MRLDTATKISLSNLRRSDAVGLSTDNLASTDIRYSRYIAYATQSRVSCDGLSDEVRDGGHSLSPPSRVCSLQLITLNNIKNRDSSASRRRLHARTPSVVRRFIQRLPRD